MGGVTRTFINGSKAGPSGEHSDNNDTANIMLEIFNIVSCRVLKTEL